MERIIQLLSTSLPSSLSSPSFSLNALNAIETELDSIRGQVECLPRASLHQLVRAMSGKFPQLLERPGILRFVARLCALDPSGTTVTTSSPPSSPLSTGQVNESILGDQLVADLATHFLQLLHKSLQSQSSFDDVCPGGLYDTAQVALHAFVDLQKNYRHLLEATVSPFLDLAGNIFASFPTYGNSFFESLAAANAGSASRRSNSRTISGFAEKAAIGTRRLKIVTELPVIVVLMFQLHRRFLGDQVSKFAPLVIRTLAVHWQPPSFPWELQAETRSFYSDLMCVKVKLLSFFAYLSRGFLNVVRTQASELPSIVLSLLRDCPCEGATSRKELLVAARHLISTDLRTVFSSFVDIFLDESLVRGGDSYMAMVVHRPLALSLQADFVHQLRSELTSDQLTSVLSTFSRALHDATLAMSMQSLAVKLLTGLLDCSANELLDLSFRRSFIMKILGTFFLKVSSLRKLIAFNSPEESSFISRKDKDLLKNPFYTSPIGAENSLILEDPPKDYPRDAKFLLRSLIGGVKSALLALRSISVAMGDSNLAQQIAAAAATPPTLNVANMMQAQRPATSPSMIGTQANVQGCGLSLEEGQFLGKFFVDALPCFGLYLWDQPTSSSSSSGSSHVGVVNTKLSPNTPAPFVAIATTNLSNEEKDVLDQFAYIFTMVETFVFLDIMSAHWNYLIERIRENPHVLMVPQYFLAAAGVSRAYTGIVLTWLTDRLDILADGNDPIATFIFMRMHKLALLALTVYTEDVEPLMLTYMSKLFTCCLRTGGRKQASNATPVNYFLMLRSLFRHVGGGKFELLYKEVTNILPTLLEEFNRILNDGRVEDALKEVVVELCLTVPVRLSTLLPYLSFLVKPLLMALQWDTLELQMQGLRTMELCIDNLTQEYLEGHLGTHLDDLFAALTALLAPPTQYISNKASNIAGNTTGSSTNALAAMRILGKFGGRARRLNRQASCSFPIVASSLLEKEAFAIVLKCEDPAYFGLADHLKINLPVTLDVFSRQISSLPKEQSISIAKYFITSFCTYTQSNMQVIPPNCLGEEFVGGSSDILVVRRLLSFLAINQQDGYFSETLMPLILKNPMKVKLLSCLVEAFFEGVASGASSLRNFWFQLYATLEQEGKGAPFLRFALEQTLIQIYQLSSMGDSAKLGAARLMDFTMNCTRLPLQVILIPYGIRLMRAILNLLKDPDTIMPCGTNPESLISNCLFKFIKCVVNGGQDAESLLQQIINLLSGELSSVCPTVRQHAQESFQLISELKGIEIVEFLVPLKDRLFSHIFAKPLRALPYNIQIGNIDAVAFYLSLKPPGLILSLDSEEMTRFLQEVLALAEAEDGALLSNKSNSFKANQIVEQLRIVCLKLLSVVLPLTEAQSPVLSSHPPISSSASAGGNGESFKSNIRNHILSVFFKSLYSRQPEVVQVSQRGLEPALQVQNKLPKDLLQYGLRPILTNFSEAKRLTVASLEGLQRVLQVMNTFFKSEIGRKLLDHFAVWADPRVLVELQGRPLTDQSDLKILAAILSAFALLPPAVNIFIGEVVTKVIEVESLVKRALASPLREPLLNYLSRYPTEFVDYFYQNCLQSPSVVVLLKDLLGRRGSEPISQAICVRISDLTILLVTHPGPSAAIKSEFLRMLNVIAERNFEFFGSDCKSFHDLLAGLWNSFRDNPLTICEEDLAHLSSLSQCYLQLQPSDFNFCFNWMNSLARINSGTVAVDLAWLPHFFAARWFRNLERQNTTECASKLFHAYLVQMASNDVPIATKCLMTRVVAVPLGKVFNLLETSTERMLVEVLTRNVALNNSLLSMADICLVNSLNSKVDISGTLGRIPNSDLVVRCAIQVLQLKRNPSNLAILDSILSNAHNDTRYLGKQSMDLAMNVLSSHPEIKVELTSLLCRTLLASSDDASAGLAAIFLVWYVFGRQPDLLSDQDNFVEHSTLLSSIIRFGPNACSVPEYRDVGFLLLEKLSIKCPAVQIQILLSCLLKCTSLCLADSNSESQTCRPFVLNALEHLKESAGRFMCDLSCLEKLIIPPNSNTPVPEDEALAVFLVSLLKFFLPASRESCGRCIDYVMAHAPVGFAVSLFSSDIQPRLQTLLVDLLTQPQQLPSLRQLETALKLLPHQLGSQQHEELLLRLLQRMTAPVIAINPPEADSGSPGTTAQANPLVQGCVLVIEQINLPQISSLGRASLSSSLQPLWTASRQITILEAILKLIRQNPGDQISATLLNLGSHLGKSNLPIPRTYHELILHMYESGLADKLQLAERLEGSFLQALLEGDSDLSSRFATFLNSSLPKGLFVRLTYGIGGIAWHLVGSRFWLPSLLRFLLAPLLPLSNSLNDSGKLETINFLLDAHQLQVSLWLDVFPALWARLSANQQQQLTLEIISLLTGEEHRQLTLTRPHSLCIFLESLSQCKDPPVVPAFLLHKCAQWYGAWPATIHLLFRYHERGISPGLTEEDTSAQQQYIALLQRLNLNDLAYGLMRRQAIMTETIIALSLGHDSRWPEQQAYLEVVQQRALNGQLPYHDGEFSTWEREWTGAAKRLQQWDLLAEVGRADDDAWLQLEALWRVTDWSSPDFVSQAASLLRTLNKNQHNLEFYGLRIKIFEGYLLLCQLNDIPDRSAAFQTFIEDAWTMALREWRVLTCYPVHCSTTPSNAINGNPAMLTGLLESFQALVELQEAFSIFANLWMPGALQRQSLLQELKGLMSTWRDRLPNRWEDFQVWGSLVSWRQFVYSQLNSVFQPLLVVSNLQPAAATGTNDDPNPSPSTTTAAGGSTVAAPPNPPHPLAYRGYHETAWMINRFAYAARKADMLDLSISYLNRIYTLPNIEIQDAFLKLREQARCYLQSPGELSVALDVVNATNLNFFNGAQKAEFFALKGLIMARLGLLGDANRVFAQAVQIDLNSAKGWAEWARFNDYRFFHPANAPNDSAEGSESVSPSPPPSQPLQSQQIFGINAVNCYLQAAALHKGHKSRRFLGRVLWLLSLDENAEEGAQPDTPNLSGELTSIGKAFEMYSGELPVWHWVMFIPQLLSALSRNEGRLVRYVLIKIAKCFPQSLYLPLRVYIEELKQKASSSSQSPNKLKFVLEECDELLLTLKTNVPLLTLSMESMVEHIANRLRPSQDEDLLRILHSISMEVFQLAAQHISALYNAPSSPPADSSMALGTIENSLRRVNEMLSNYPYLLSRYKAEFDADFGQLSQSGDTLWTMMTKLRRWIERLNVCLPAPKGDFTSLDSISRIMMEYEYQKYEDLELPGQSLLGRDNPGENIKLVRWAPRVLIVRRHGTSFRLGTCLGSDGKYHRFLMQNPVSRSARKEERLLQLHRLYRGGLQRKLRSRRRNLDLSVPSIVAISTHCRLIETIAASDDVEDHEGFAWSLEDYLSDPDGIVVSCLQTLSEHRPPVGLPDGEAGADLLNQRVRLLERYMGAHGDVLVNLFSRRHALSSDLLGVRWQFAQHYGEQCAAMYLFAVGHRQPHKVIVHLSSGQCINVEQLPSVNNAGQLALMEAVPFRLGPSVQRALGSVVTEGVLVAVLVSFCQALNTGEHGDLGVYLPLFLRDEMAQWFLSSPNASTSSPAVSPLTEEALFSNLLQQQSQGTDTFLGKIRLNAELITKRLQTLAGAKLLERVPDNLTVPINQNALDLLACATNVQKLALMDPTWHPWI